MDRRRIVLITVAVLVVAFILILIGYQLGWTGFNAYDVTVHTNGTKEASLPTNITVTLPSKTLYDWLQLLIVTMTLAVIAVIALVFQLANTRTERQIAQQNYEQDQKSAQQRYEQDQRIALDKQREELLQMYLDRMSELLLKEQLLSSAVATEVRNVARVRTITALTQLDGRRVGQVFAFLRESRLMRTMFEDNPLSLDEADFNGVDWSKANLRDTNLYQSKLSGANLSEAFIIGANLNGAVLDGANLSRATLNFSDLTRAHLIKANLSEADLRGVDLSGADLRDANLRKAIVADVQLSEAQSLQGAIMPDGSIHP